MKNCKLAATLVIGLSSISVHAYEAPFAAIDPVIDGKQDDPAWSNAVWQRIDSLILGKQPSHDDFSGRFKVVWSKKKIYVLTEIVDDVLIDSNADPLNRYWEDDTLEIFIDEDKSGGYHLDTYNAFAYHLSLDNQAVDQNSRGKPRTFNDHITSVWKRLPDNSNKIVWEASIDVFPDTFKDNNNTVMPLNLNEGKELGFMVAYSDSDGVSGREHFISSHDIEAVNCHKNRGYIDASVFGYLKLVRSITD